MDKEDLIKRLKYERKDYDEPLLKIELKKLEKEIILKKWTLKDEIAHISYYENEVLDVLKKKSIKGILFWKKSADERNEEIFNQTNSKSVKEIKNFTSVTFQALLKETESLTQE